MCFGDWLPASAVTAVVGPRVPGAQLASQPGCCGEGGGGSRQQAEAAYRAGATKVLRGVQAAIMRGPLGAGSFPHSSRDPPSGTYSVS